MHRFFAFGLASVLMFTAAARGQSRFIINDRAADSMHRALDGDNNSSLNDPGEINLWFSAANAAGTIGPLNPSCLDISPNGIVAMGDQDHRVVYRLVDMNNDGDVQDEGERAVFADATNASLISLASPTGAAFDSLNRMHVANAGNTFGNDRVFRLVDLNSDGDAQDAAEITEYVGASFFGPGNGSFSPQEIFFDENNVLFLRNSSSGLQGVWRFEDADASGGADDPGEATVFFDSTNASGITISAGFALEPDRVRPRAMYILLLASGGADQLLRLTDLNQDDDAQDAGEAVMVWSTTEGSFLNVDVVCLYNGDVLITDNNTKRVILLHDADNNDLFDNATERTNLFTAATTAVVDIRQMSILPVLGDINRDGVRDAADVPAFVDVLVDLDSNAFHRIASDVNRDGTADGRDIDIMTHLFTGP